MTPDPVGQGPVLLYNGTIHSVAEPYAEAMIVDNGQIAWLGSDETAEHVAAEQSTRWDLDRALITPAFVGYVTLSLEEANSATVATVLDVAARSLGYGALRLAVCVSAAELAQEPSLLQGALAETFTAAAGHPVDVYPVVELRGVHADGGAPSISPVNELLDLLPAVDEAAGKPAALAVQLSEVLPNLLGIRSWCVEANRQLLLDTQDLDPAVVSEALTTTQRHLRDLKQTPSPDAPTVLLGFDSAQRDHWEALLNANLHVVLRKPGHLATALSVGVPISAAPVEGENPWNLISDHVHHGQDPVSARAGFNAQTRGAYRSLVGAPSPAGQLNPGVPATYTVWEVDSLSVQTPHSTAAAWSTDTRARTPLLPFLDGDTLPRLISTVVTGAEV